MSGCVTIRIVKLFNVTFGFYTAVLIKSLICQSVRCYKGVTNLLTNHRLVLVS